MLRTHLAIVVLAVLLFLAHIPSAVEKVIFVAVALISTALPDIDTGFSTIGKMQPGKIVQFFARHRGVFHSLTFCILVSVVLAAFIPILSLPFFLGYGLHLFADSFTIEGIKPFWPLRAVSSWKIRTGRLTETTLFVFFLFADALMFFFMIKSIF